MQSPPYVCEILCMSKKHKYLQAETMSAHDNIFQKDVLIFHEEKQQLKNNTGCPGDIQYILCGIC